MIVETRDNQVVRLRPRPNEAVNKYFMCDHGRLNYRWMNRQDRVDVPLVRQARRARVRRLGDRAARQRPRCSRASVRSCSRRRTCPTKRCSCSGDSSKKTGGAGAFRVPQGAEAPLPGVEDLALRADRAANGRGAELMGFTRSETPLSRTRRR